MKYFKVMFFLVMVTVIFTACGSGGSGGGEARNVVPADSGAPGDELPVYLEGIARVSLSIEGTQRNNESYHPSLSGDGRYVAYSSYTGTFADGKYDIYVHDLVSGETKIVSVSNDGTVGNDDSYSPSISWDGRYVAFVSSANNLLANNEDTNGQPDIFVHDLESGVTKRVSVSSQGTQCNGGSDLPSISGDGRYVAFRSLAFDLVKDDTNITYDIFVHDLESGETKRVSVSSDGIEANFGSYQPSISGDGRYVAFKSFASNLVANDTNGKYDIFVHDLESGETKRVSVSSDGTAGNDDSHDPSISGDGRYVVFYSEASDLVVNDTNGKVDIFIHDLVSGETKRVSVSSDGTAGNDNSYSPSVSGDGRYVAFSSYAKNLVEKDTNGRLDVFVHDRDTGQTRRFSVNSDGIGGNDNSGDEDPSSISRDGRYIAFDSSASNLVEGDTNGEFDIFETPIVFE